MKVSELMQLLSQFDDDAEVILGIQPSWPFEHRIRGVVERQDFVDPDEEGNDLEETEASDCGDSFTTRGKPNDVVICEGGQIRYGNRDMFESCYRL